jgi:uncharacterized protein YcbK (DUF882 family)
MGDISKNFSRSEFACKCGCGMDTVDSELLELVQVIRDKFGPINITSANRCEKHNAKVGGVKGSQHTKSRAADIVPVNASIGEVHTFIIENFNNIGIGLYNSFIHVDSRGHKAIWGG